MRRYVPLDVHVASFVILMSQLCPVALTGSVCLIETVQVIVVLGGCASWSFVISPGCHFVTA